MIPSPQEQGRRKWDEKMLRSEARQRVMFEKNQHCATEYNGSRVQDAAQKSYAKE